MAKEKAVEATETPVEASVPNTPNLTFEQLQQLMVGAIAAFVDKQKEPTATEKERKKRDKEHWRALIKSIEENTKAEQAKCSHMHKHARKSLIAKMEMCAPRNGWTLICQQCFKVWQNYDRETLQPKDDLEFAKWWNTESLVDM